MSAPSASVSDAFDAHDAYEDIGDGFAVMTTTFDATVTVLNVTDSDTADGTVESDSTDNANTTTTTYQLLVRVPTIDAATVESVGDAVAADWLRTLSLRAEDAPAATRADVSLQKVTVEEWESEVEIEFVFSRDAPKSAASIAKTFAEYVEGCYVEGIIPGYEYEEPVASLLARASHEGKSGTPL